MFPKRKATRIPEYNYSSNGAYFITICTINKKYLFGKIENNTIFLNEFGKIAQQCWGEIPNHFDNVIVNEYCIMPNHIHGIIIVGCNDRCTDNDYHSQWNNHVYRNNYSQRDNHVQRDNDRCPLRARNMELVPKIISQYKSSITRTIQKNINKNITIWQRSFYEHIVRNEKDMFRIQEYIMLNPIKWELDEYFAL